MSACPLAMRGYSHDELRGSLQIVYGLLCDQAGPPRGRGICEGKTLTLDHQTVRARSRSSRSASSLAVCFSFLIAAW
jgi:hypothetical protein